jgi:hypothetical protein
MQVYPDMTIRFPPSREAELIERMKARARPPWRLQPPEAVADVCRDDYYFFGRGEVGAIPPVDVCLLRGEPGKLTAINIIQRVDTRAPQLTIEQYVGILREFDQLIAEPAAEEVGGMTAIETHERGLADYFTAESVDLLRFFCKTSNVSTLGAHPTDREKWMRFLVSVHRSGIEVRPETFWSILEGENLWPKEGIDQLVREYEFAMELLQSREPGEVGPWAGPAQPSV